jgi:hypothetical protein
MRERFFIVGLVGLLMLALGGCCRPPVQRGGHPREYQSDSVLVQERVRIDTVQLQGDSILVEIPIECDSLTNQPKPIKYRFESSLSSLTVSGSGIFSIQSIRRPQQMTLPGIDRIEYRNKVVEKEIPVIEYRSRWYDKFCRWFTILVLLPLLTAIILKLRKLSPL